MNTPVPNFTAAQIADLVASGIPPEIAAAAGWRCERDPKKVQDLLGWKYPAKTLGACLVIPYLAADGTHTGYHRVKPATPLTEKRDGGERKRKYEAPKGVRPHAYIPPGTRASLADSTAAMIVTEGEKKALAASDVFGFPTVGLSGVDSWRAKGGRGKMLPELAAAGWAGRPVFIVYDSDAATNPDVRRAEVELAAALAASGAVVKVVRLPSAAAVGGKVGLDDFLVASGPDALAELLDTAEPFAPPEEGVFDASDNGVTPACHQTGLSPEVIAEQLARQRKVNRDVKDMAARARDPDKPVSALGRLMIEAKREFDFFRSPAGHPFASADGVTALTVGGQAFADALHRLHRTKVDDKEPATGHAVKTVSDSLAALARGGETLPVFERSGVCGGRVYVHRNDPAAMGEVVVIDPDGWRVCPPCPDRAEGVRVSLPVRFALPPSAGTLPMPAGAGDLDALRPFVNLEDAGQFPVLCAWLGAAVLSAWPVPILSVCGQQGSSKSTLAKLALKLIDPAAVALPHEEPLRLSPKDAETLAVAARNAHVLAFDNLSGLDNDIADVFCQMVTSGTYTTRKKYTDGDEYTVNIRRPIILTGIDRPTNRGDLLERMLSVRMRPIAAADRTTEADLFARFDAARPAILAGLYALVARGLNPAADLAGMQLPRMADFGRFAAAAVGRAEVEGRLAAIGVENAEASLDAYAWVPPLRSLMAVRYEWTGTAAELLAELEVQYRVDAGGRRSDLPKRWPGAPHVLSGQLERAAPALVTVDGLAVVRWKKGTGGDRRTVWTVRHATADEATTKRPQDDPEATQPKKSLVELLDI